MTPTHSFSFKRQRLAVAIASILAAPAYAAVDCTVSVASDDGSGNTANTLSWAIKTANTDVVAKSGHPGGGCSNNTVTLTTDVTVTGVMRRLIDSNLTLQGDSSSTLRTISGGDAYRPLFVKSGTVTIKDLNLSNNVAKGGDGHYAGPGAGLGGALFVYGGAVTLQNVNFANNSAKGGNNADASGTSYFGGGGMWGVGTGALGGGGGLFGSSGNSGLGGYGGTGNYGGAGGKTTTQNGGVGGAGGFGGGGGVGIAVYADGGAGGFGGGGGVQAGGSSSDRGGAGGFGGGGGTGGAMVKIYSDWYGGGQGGSGGFGGGGGVGGYSVGVGGYGGGTSGLGHLATTTGGAGFGGAIFVKKGTLTLQSVSFSNNSAVRGTGGNNGKGKGGAIFVCTADLDADNSAKGAKGGCSGSIDEANSYGVTLSGGAASDGQSDLFWTGASGGAHSTLGLTDSSITVTSIALANSPADNASSMNVTVTFSQAVSGVDASDFTLTATGTALGIVGMPTSSDGGITWTIPITGLVGVGTLRLDLNAGGTGIAATATGKLPISTAGFTGGTVHTVNASCLVSSATDDGSGNIGNTLSWAINTANTNVVAASGHPGGGCPNNTITLTTDVTLTGVMKRLIDSNVTLQSDNSSTPRTISGNNRYRPLFVKSGSVTITNLILKNGLAQGGKSTDAGNGAGLGGALFVYGGAVTVNNVTFANNKAQGGVAGGSGLTGGGGMYGSGGSHGGGGGLFSAGGTSGGYGGSGNYGGSIGYFGGGGNYSTAPTQGGFGGGGGETNGTGGTGGFGGGGGFSAINVGGAAGFGGGGGGGNTGNGGAAGYGAGKGRTSTSPKGGGGAGFGGAIFVKRGTLALQNVTFSANSAIQGTGANSGNGKGGAIFVCTGDLDSDSSAKGANGGCSGSLDEVNSYAVTLSTGTSANVAAQGQSDLFWKAASGGAHSTAGITDSNSAPIITSVSTGLVSSELAKSAAIGNASLLGQRFAGRYTYFDAENDAEEIGSAGTRFRWVRADSEDMRSNAVDIVSGHTGGTLLHYNLQAGDLKSRHLFYCVTPRARTGTPNGNEVCSSPSSLTSLTSTPAGIPTLSEWTMALLSLLLGGLTWRELRQRIPASPFRPKRD